MLTALRKRLASESGFSLPELLAGLAIGLLVAAAGGVVLMMAVRNQPVATDRAGDLQQGRVLVETLTRELRQGQQVFDVSPTGLSMLTWVHTASCGSGATGPSQLCQVSYSCDESSCTRSERNPDGTGSAAPVSVIEGITGPNVFWYRGDSSAPSYVGMHFVFPKPDGGEAVSFIDGVALRNYFDPSGGSS